MSFVDALRDLARFESRGAGGGNSLLQAGGFGCIALCDVMAGESGNGPLPGGALDRAWTTLREKGNLSSTSVLLVLGEVLEHPPPEGGRALVTAMGPGFCSELVLLEF